ncbi:MAG: fibronectin type III domain-containing protein [Ignavibacteriaceae bacterium]
MTRQLYFMFSILLVLVFFTGLTHAQSDPPSNLQASNSNKALKLTWEVPGNGQEVVYNIYRAEVQSTSDAADPMKLNFTKVSTVKETTFEDRSAAPGQAYVYYVVSVNQDGVESAGSNYVNVKIGEKDAEAGLY